MISVVIPAYNEENNIGRTLNELIMYMKNNIYPYEIIVVDDGSTDKTREIVDSYANVRINKRRQNEGKGYSVKEGMLMAKGDYAIFMDADSPIPLDEIYKLYTNAEEFDVVIGSKYLPESKYEQSKVRLVVGKLFRTFVHVLFNIRVTDTQCGLKMFSKKAIDIIFPKSRIRGYGFDVELLLLATKNNLDIKEVPVTLYKHYANQLNPFVDGIKMFIDLVKIRYNEMRGKYD